MKEMLTPMNLLEEHLPSGISVLIVGPPGSGKTIFSQHLVYQTLKRDESVICIASKSQIAQIFSEKKLFNWDIAPSLENNQVGVVEIGDVADPTELNISLARMITQIRKPLSLVVVDSLTALMVGMEEKKIMKFTEGLARKLQDQKVSLLLLITPTKETEDFLTKMKSLVSSVIEIELKEEEEAIRRFIRIFKFLGQGHSTSWYSFEITDEGIQFATPSISTPAAFLFDLDGTLVTMELDFVQIRKDIDTLLVEKGFPEALLDSSVSTLEIIEHAADYLRDHGLDWEAAQEEAETHLEQTELEAASKAVQIRGAVGVLKILKEKKKKVGVITRNNREVALQVLKRCELHPYVDVLLTRDDVDNVKPHPAHVVQAMKELGSSPERTVVVGDHRYEIEAGNEAKCFTIGVLTGIGTRKTLKDANVILNSIKDLGKILTAVG